MQELTVRIRFNNVCLGSVQKKNCNEMLRDPDGRVMFLPTWWRSVTVFAARVLNRHQDLVREIDWDPLVEGTPKMYKRYYKPGRYTLHEAFLCGDAINVHCVIPTGMTVEDLKTIMEVVGTYKGISPYKPDLKYGTFQVVEVVPKVRETLAALQA
jgi:hypothetical protein